MLFFSLVVLWPIHRAFDVTIDPPSNPDELYLDTAKRKDKDDDKSSSYLWSYLVFTWFFSCLTLYYMNSETFKVVKVRQDYLGTQSTVTDRTFRLTGIPKDLRNEEKIKEFVENLEIGHVRSVSLCRHWAEIDGLMVQRRNTLHQLEEAWSAYRSQKAMVPRAAIRGNVGNGENEQADDHDEHAEENGQLLAGSSLRDLVGERERPKIRLRFGFLKLRNRRIEYVTRYHIFSPDGI